jgi:hypothetical protein
MWQSGVGGEESAARVVRAESASPEDEKNQERLTDGESGHSWPGRPTSDTRDSGATAQTGEYATSTTTGNGAERRVEGERNYPCGGLPGSFSAAGQFRYIPCAAWDHDGASTVSPARERMPRQDEDETKRDLETQRSEGVAINVTVADGGGGGRVMAEQSGPMT